MRSDVSLDHLSTRLWHLAVMSLLIISISTNPESRARASPD